MGLFPFVSKAYPGVVFWKYILEFFHAWKCSSHSWMFVWLDVEFQNGNKLLSKCCGHFSSFQCSARKPDYKLIPDSLWANFLVLGFLFLGFFCLPLLLYHLKWCCLLVCTSCFLHCTWHLVSSCTLVTHFLNFWEMFCYYLFYNFFTSFLPIFHFEIFISQMLDVPR